MEKENTLDAYNMKVQTSKYHDPCKTRTSKRLYFIITLPHTKATRVYSYTSEYCITEYKSC